MEKNRRRKTESPQRIARKEKGRVVTCDGEKVVSETMVVIVMVLVIVTTKSVIVKYKNVFF